MISLRHYSRGLLLLSFAVLASLVLSIAVAPSVLADNNNDLSDMNDRLATDKGASGLAVSKVKDGNLDLHLVAKGLPTDTDLEVHVVVGSGPDFGGDGFFDFTVFPITSDKNGRIKFDLKGFNLGLPEEGIYRLDFLVVHAGDFLLACEPAPIISFNG